MIHDIFSHTWNITKCACNFLANADVSVSDSCIPGIFQLFVGHITDTIAQHSVELEKFMKLLGMKLVQTAEAFHVNFED
jgi:hypothetical protein